MERTSETKLTLKVLGLSWVGSFEDLVLFVCMCVRCVSMVLGSRTPGFIHARELFYQRTRTPAPSSAFKIISINSCFTYKNSNFIWLNILNKCSGPVLKVSRFSFLATINTWRKFTYRGSAALLRSVPPSCFVSIWVFSRRCWTSGSFTTSIVCSSNNPKCQYLYHCH